MTSRLFNLSQSIRSVLRPLGVEHAHFLKPIYRRFKQTLKKRTAEVEGFTLALDEGDSLDLSLSSDYEIFERSLLKKWIRQGDTVLDIGAHIGLFTLIMSRLVGPRGRVFSFEPFPDSHQLLLQNIESNGVDHVIVSQSAVSSDCGRASFFLNPENSGDHCLFDPENSRPMVDVETIRLDDYAPLREGSVDFIKMDIQGAELHALKGMSEILDRNPAIRILMEFWPLGLKRSGTEPVDLLDFLFARDFKVFHLEEEDRIQEIQREDNTNWVEGLQTSFKQNAERHTNLLAVGHEGRVPD